jgi:endo-1,4-beta-xylanase
MTLYLTNLNQNIMKNNAFFKKETLAKGIVRGALSLSVASMLLFASCSKDEVNAETPVEQNNAALNSASTARTGTINGRFYTIDAEENLGPVSVTSPSGGNTFRMTWSGVRQMVGGVGWSSTQRRTVNYNISSVSGPGVKFVGIYGWTRSPLTEYYVCEQGGGAVFSGQFAGNNYNVDNRTYTMRKNYRDRKPSIESLTSSFWQVEGRWGGAVNGRNYSVNVGAHLDNFRGAMGSTFGLQLTGTNQYMVFGCEAYDYGNGGANRISGTLNASVW